MSSADGAPPSSSAAVRPASGLTSLMALLQRDPDMPPFSIEPRAGEILPGAAQSFSVCFSPSEVRQFQGRLLCR